MFESAIAGADVRELFDIPEAVVCVNVPTGRLSCLS